MNCEVGVTRATDKKCCIYAEDPYNPLPEGEEPYSHTENYRIFEEVLKIDGKLHRWKAYPVRRYDQSSDEEYQAEYGYNVRVDLAEWRKRSGRDTERRNRSNHSRNTTARRLEEGQQ